MIRVLLILLLTAGCALGEVRLAGGDASSAGELRRELRSAGSLEEFRTQVTGSLFAEGYLAAMVEIKADRDTSVTISEGKRYRVSDVVIGGIDTNVVMQKRLTASDSPLTTARMAELTRSVVEAYADAGYPFCQATVEQMDIRGDEIEIEYAVVTGPRATFGQVHFTGLVSTRSERLRDRLKLEEGRSYRESLVRQGERSLAMLNYTRSISAPVVAHDTRTNSANVVFAMKDERNLTLDGLFFLNSDNTIGGSGELDLLNIFGTGERVGLHWSRQNKNSRDLGLGVELPYAGGYPVDISLDIVQSDRDSAYVSAKIQAGAMYHLSEQWQIGSMISWEKITPDEGRVSPSARIAGVTLKTAFQKRDRLRTTRKGLVVTTEFGSLYRRSFDSGSDVSTGYSTVIKAHGELWQPFGNKWVFYQRLVPFQIRSDFDPIPAEQLMEIGGAASMRGYRERSYLADIGVVSATELRYLFEDDFIVRMFCDNAVIEIESGPRQLTGFGLGMELETTMGRFRLDFSLGEEKQLDAMLVHFGFETGL